MKTTQHPSESVAEIPLPSDPKPKRYTLEQAFDYFNSGPDDEFEDFNNERCVRAVAFLLHYCSEMGNENMHGYAAHGLGHVLDRCANQMGWADTCMKRAQELKNNRIASDVGD